jgi:predicted RNase H-like HicB family nuclease
MLEYPEPQACPDHNEGFSPPDNQAAHQVFVRFHTIIIPRCDRTFLPMKTLIDIHREGKFFVATDILSNVADQGLSEKEALENLTRGLEEHYRLIIDLTPQGHTLSYREIEVEKYVRDSPAFIH